MEAGREMRCGDVQQGVHLRERKSSPAHTRARATGASGLPATCDATRVPATMRNVTLRHGKQRENAQVATKAMKGTANVVRGAVALSNSIAAPCVCTADAGISGGGSASASGVLVLA